MCAFSFFIRWLCVFCAVCVICCDAIVTLLCCVAIVLWRYCAVTLLCCVAIVLWRYCAVCLMCCVSGVRALAERSTATLCRVESGSLHQSIWYHCAEVVRQCTGPQVAGCARHCHGMILLARPCSKLAGFYLPQLFVNTFRDSVILASALNVAGWDNSIVVGV